MECVCTIFNSNICCTVSADPYKCFANTVYKLCTFAK